MLKLMYIGMLGYATEFGQMEIVKLLAEGDFGSKRVGYLALGILMDETQEVLTLAENHIKRDLTAGTNPFIQALALDVIANIAGADMSRDMMNEVLELCSSSNSHLKKKATLAAHRMIRKAPELCDVFLDYDSKSYSALNDRNHGVLLTYFTLLGDLLSSEAAPHYIESYVQLAPQAISLLRQLNMSPGTGEHDVGNVTDPFLQVKLLRFLRILGAGNTRLSEQMNDALAQVATNTDASKNAGCAVLYECVRTIIAVESDDGLRTLAYNILGRFMARENNARFVALAMFLDVVRTDVAVAQRQRTTVLDCLKDNDLGIRRRALQLTVALVDETNVRLMTADLMAYLGVCADEMKAEATRQVCGVIQSKAPSDEWRVEVTIKLLKSDAIQAVPDDFALSFIYLLSNVAADLQQRALSALWAEFERPLDANMLARTALWLTACWTVGEFGEKLGADDRRVIDVLAQLARESSARNVTLYALNAAGKYASKKQAARASALALFDAFAASMDVEFQQRACEYSVVLRDFPDVAAFCLAAAPEGTPQAAPRSQTTLAATSLGGAAPAAPAPDFMEELFSGGAAAARTAPSASMDIFGGVPAAAKAPSPPPAQSPAASAPDDIFGEVTKAAPPAAAPAPARPSAIKFTAFSDVGVVFDVVATPKTANDYSTIDVQGTLQVDNTDTTDAQILVAVPRTATLKVLSARDVGRGVKQQNMTVSCSDAAKAPVLAMKVKITFTMNGTQQTHNFQFSRDLRQ